MGTDAQSARLRTEVVLLTALTAAQRWTWKVVAAMAEYIERRKVSNACYAVFEDVVRDPKNLTGEEVRQTLLRFERAINSVSSADVAPVRHGRWYWAKDGHCKCSVCEQYATVKRLVVKTNYCPNCGAKMDLEGGGGA